MKKFLLVILMVFLATTVNAASLLFNGDFEEAASGYGNQFTNKAWDENGWNVWASLPGWETLTGPGIEVQKSPTVTDSQSGSHHVELDSHGGTDTNSSMYQTVYLTEGSYDLSFWYYGRTNDIYNDNDNGIFAGIADTSDAYDYSYFCGTISNTVHEWQAINWSFEITTAADYNLTFGAYGLDNTLGGLIDNVSLEHSSVPEPTIMTLFGIGLLGIAGIRRNKIIK